MSVAFLRWSSSSLGLLLVLFSPIILAKIQVPKLSAPVVDEAGLLPSGLKTKINHALIDLRDQTGTQVGVLTVKSLQGQSIEQFSIQVTDEWQLGSAKGDRGVLLVVAPTERKLRIEVGQGLEGDLTDVQANRIITQAITPLFKNGDLASGILVGVFQIVKLTNPDFVMDSYFEAGEDLSLKPSGKRGSDRWIFALFLIFIIFSFFGGGRRRGFLFLLLAGLGGRSSRGMGGGWSGGGGGFSGGGASGSW